MSHISQIPHLAEELIAKRAIATDDVLRLRQELWKDGVVTRDEATQVFALDHECASKATEWREFYVDALTEYFVWKATPPRHVTDAQSLFLMEHILTDSAVSSETELELLINIVHWCESCPEPLAMFALWAVRNAVLTPQTAIYGSNHPPAVITPGDVEIIRKVIYAPGSAGGFTVTHDEAELMFELNNATSPEDNAPDWNDLFVKAVANYLMFPSAPPKLPAAKEALRREQWLNDRRGVGNLFKAMGKAARNLDIPFTEVWESIDPFGARQAREEKDAEDARIKEAMSREAIDAQEAKWLIGQINADGTIKPAERALLAFIKANSPSIDPLLQDFMAKVGV